MSELNIHPQYDALSSWAWHGRNKAMIRGGLENAVGCAVVNAGGYIVEAGNIEIPFRRGMHAEVVAMTRSLMERRGARIEAILVAAEREQFTPCGDCMDWIWHLGHPDTQVICENAPGQLTLIQPAKRLMPFYPRG